MADQRVDELHELAISTATEGRPDSDVVKQLRDQAGTGGEALLTRAADNLTNVPGFPVEELRDWDHAYRLLRAAAADETTQPVSVERAKFFDEVRALDGAPLESGWARLVEGQPKLLEVEANMRRAATVLRDSGSDESARVAALESLFSSQNTALVGPDAEGVSDPLLRTTTALAVADQYLLRAYGVETERRYTRPVAVGRKKQSSITTTYERDDLWEDRWVRSMRSR